MVKYLILQYPGHSRMFYEEAGPLAVAELKLASRRLSVKCTDIGTQDVAGVRYITLNCNDDLSTDDIAILSRLSFVFAIFHQFGIYAEDGLLPIPCARYEYMDSKISTLQKYSNKPNELFRRMMVNVALLASDFSYQDDISLLDPVSGRGTTLNEAAVYGFHAFGIEIEHKVASENQVFVKKFLQNERYKYLSDRRMVYGKKKSEAIYIDEFEYANTKEAFKVPEQRKKLGIVNGLTQDVDKYFRKNSFNLIVGDLPGVNTGGNNNKVTQNPLELIRSSLPAWNTVLKKGGAVVLAWNSLGLAKIRLVEMFEKEGFTVMKDVPYNGFEHLVDRATKRDIIVAKKE